MPVRLTTAGGIDWHLRRGDAVVCIPLSGTPAPSAACLKQLGERTPAELRVVVVEDDVEGTLAALAPADVVLLAPDCVVADGWLESLRAAAYADSTIATASPLCSADLPLAPGSDFDLLAAAVRRRSLRIRPRVTGIRASCTYVKRSALELVGERSWNGDFAARCLRAGLSHVVADDVVIASYRVQSTHADTRAGGLIRAINAARRVVSGLSVVIDARVPDGYPTGTHRHVMELIGALVGTGEIRVRALTHDSNVREKLTRVDGVELIEADGKGPTNDLVNPADVDLVHRPFQITSISELMFLHRAGERLIVTNHDLIGYRNPEYFASRRDFQEYRRLTRRALAVADHVVFPSAHALADALADDLVDPHRASVVGNGVDHPFLRETGQAVRPPAAARLPERAEMILCLGTDYRHKNRLFALRVLDQLGRRHEWNGYLVFAGPHVPHGSSAMEEAEFLGRVPALAQRTIDVGPVDEEEKLWLLERAALVIYPTVYEGFGLLPFEAAAHDVPCMWAAGTALAEVLPEADAPIVPWDAAATADHALELLRGRDDAHRNVALIRAAGEDATWDLVARQLLEIYHATCDQPRSAASALERMGPTASVSDDGLRLVGPDGALPADLERPLLALATHPRIGAPVFGAIRRGYRAARLTRRVVARSRGRIA